MAFSLTHIEQETEIENEQLLLVLFKRSPTTVTHLEYKSINHCLKAYSYDSKFADMSIQVTLISHPVRPSSSTHDSFYRLQFEASLPFAFNYFKSFLIISIQVFPDLSRILLPATCEFFIQFSSDRRSTRPNLTPRQ